MTQISYSEYLLLKKGAAPPPDPHAAGVRVYADTDGALRSIQSDGTDAAVGGGGGSLPEQWTVDDRGNVVFAPTDVDDDGQGNLVVAPLLGTGSTPTVKIIAAENTNDGLAVTDFTNPTGINFGVDPFGYVSGQGADFSTSEDVKVLGASGVSGGGQVQDIAQFANVTVNRRVRVLRSGHLLLQGANAAPDDAVISAGSVAFWFDQTNGAAKLMVKGKTADGTVVTGNLPLS